ncbi:MAG: hypothetical protein M3O62_01615 [Pseudomonadota bacterium]|nr:hypothetical protein [Pseudomonadota bacterium]
MPNHDPGVVEEVARIICDERVIDYRAAKRKAAERLGLPPNFPLPDNATIHAAVIEYQRLFGGEAYALQLQRMRKAALSACRLFAHYSPRVVGATISGAVTSAHRVQIHLFCDSAEMIDIELINRRIAFDQGERNYRYANGRDISIPLLCLDIDGQGVDAAVFGEHELRQAPINPLDGQRFKRIDAAELEQLLHSGP